MKILFIYLSLVLTTAYAGTCTSISRTNNAASSVLTSTKYNADLNTSYDAHNSFDGGCTTDGTLESGSLNSTSFSVPLNSNRQGCRVTYNTAATIEIEECYLAVNGKWVTTATETAVTWANIASGSETASTQYYIYASSTSSGSTITPIISITAPGDNGYDTSMNRVLGSFYNDDSSNIATTTVYQWEKGEFGNATAKMGTAYLEDQQTSGTAGQVVSSANSVTLRDITTLFGDTSFISLSANYFTLDSGTYKISATAPALGTGPHKAFLVNNTDTTYPIEGTNALASTTSQTSSSIDGVITITSQKQFFIGHYSTLAGASVVLGYPSNGVNNPQDHETYLRISIVKIK